MFLQGSQVGVIEYFHYDWFHQQFNLVQDIPPPPLWYLHLEYAPVSGVSLLTYSPTILRAGEDAPAEDVPIDDVGASETFASWWATELVEFFGSEETNEHLAQRVQVDTTPKIVTEELASVAGGDDFTMEDFEGLDAGGVIGEVLETEEGRAQQPEVLTQTTFERGESSERSAASYEVEIEKLQYVIDELHTLQDAFALELAHLRGDIASMRTKMITLKHLDSAHVRYRLERDTLHRSLMDATARIAELSGGLTDSSVGTSTPIDEHADQLRECDYYRRAMELWLPGFPRYSSDGPSSPPRSAPRFPHSSVSGCSGHSGS